MKRVFLVAAVVVVNAVVQALCVVPGATPAVTPGFLGLLAASVGALGAAATAVVALVGGPGARWLRALAAVALSLVIVGALAVVSSTTLLPALLVAFVFASPAGTPDATAWSGPRAFAWHPVRAVLLAVLTALAIAVLVVAALLFGFLVTGGLGSFLTWVVVGALAALLARAWARLAVRPRRSV
ncbi:hypothetical protein [Microbacterium sp. RURRCA19A]|uniref:hypothetical protein n=1 Tax=Microbacterium sp. RURRCA19A TaxID=1907391 RepID=UPI0009540C5B|nr:hypothetical protein [Microbacterium sp. RURRCA19A]SIR89889.1 hypothetical protein SAMN05880568_1666 [Microbacterium sp. RURRCA19A]